MKTSVKSKLHFLIIFVALTASACGAGQGTTNSTADDTPIVATVDTRALAAEVLADVEAQLAQPTESVIAVSNASQNATIDSLEAELIDVYEQANPGVVYI